MAFTRTAPTQPKFKPGGVTYEEHIMSGGAGTETTTGNIPAQFLNRIDRAFFEGQRVLSKTIDNNADPPTVNFTIEGPQPMPAGGAVVIATTGNTEINVVVSQGGSLVSADFSGTDALAANDTNFITFSITNLGQGGAGSTAMLAATDANTTKATGGSAIGAGAKRSLTLHGTAANLVVVAGDRLRIRFAATGTLANAVNGAAVTLRFAGATEGVVVLESDNG